MWIKNKDWIDLKWRIDRLEQHHCEHNWEYLSDMHYYSTSMFYFKKCRECGLKEYISKEKWNKEQEKIYLDKAKEYKC